MAIIRIPIMAGAETSSYGIWHTAGKLHKHVKVSHLSFKRSKIGNAVDACLLLSMIFDKIYKVSIDEACQFDIDSDHVPLSLSFYSKTVKQANSNKCKPKSV